MKGKNVKQQSQLSEGIDDISTSRVREPFIPKSASATPKRAERTKGTSMAAPVVARKLAKKLATDAVLEEVLDRLPALPALTEVERVGVAKTYVLTRTQRTLIERHALQRFNLGLTGRIDYSAPLRDIVDFFLEHEEEGNAFIANRFKNQGNR